MTYYYPIPDTKNTYKPKTEAQRNYLALEALKIRQKKKGQKNVIKTILLNGTPKNWQKLEDTLKEIQKGCTARTVDTDDIKNIIKEIEKNLYMRRLPKSSWDGLIVYCNPYKEQFANAYKHAPNGTIFNLAYYNDCWRILSLDRGICSGSPKRQLEYCFTEEQKQKMLDGLSYDEVYF